METWNPKRKPKCPKCGKEMTLCTARSHYYWLCVGPLSMDSHYPIQLGIKGQDAWFQFRKLVDPVTLQVEDNPYFKDKNKG